MKKLLTGILASTMLLSTMSMTAMAQENQETPQEIQTATLASTFYEDTGIYSFYNDEKFHYEYDSCYDEYTEWYAEHEYFAEEFPTFLDYFAYQGNDYCTTVRISDEVKEQVQSVVIEDGVVGITGRLKGDYTSVYIPKSLVYVLDNSFNAIEVEVTDSLHTSTRDYTILPEGEDYLAYLDSLNNSNHANYGYFYDASTLTTVYYEGSEADRANMDVSGGYTGSNYPFMNATWVYNSTGIGTGTPETTTPESSSYPDWASSFVDFVSGDIMPDITPENYNTASNRGLIAQSFYNMSANGANVTASHSFTDIGDFGTAVAWCHENEIMSGTGATTFGTYGNVNREQFCLILKQMATVLEKDTASGDVASLSDFSDQGDISEWAKEGVAWATANNLMAGNDGALNPQGDVTRLEVAIMLSAFDQL